MSDISPGVVKGGWRWIGDMDAVGIRNHHSFEGTTGDFETFVPAERLD